MKKTISILFLLLAVAVQAEVITWQAPEGFASDKYYRVKVNGVDVPVFDTPIASYATFDFTGEVNVEVNTMFDVRWVDIRPMRLNLKPEYNDDHTFSVKLNNPCNISLELNGRIRQQPLFIFANSPEKNRPNKNDKNVIWFEQGKLYKDVALEVKDNRTVYIEGGAVLQGYIWANGAKNIKIIGRGIMDGTYVREMPNRKQFISLTDCKDVEISDVILQNATTWQIATWNCENVNITNPLIVSESASDDGIDIVRSRNVVIDGGFIHTKDDCIVIKSHGKTFANDVNTDGILVKNSVLWNSIWGNAIEIGFELVSDKVQNIRFENIDIIHVEDGSAISIHNADRSAVKNIVFENIRIEDCRQKLFDLAIFYSKYSVDGIRDNDYEKNNYMHGAWDGVLYMPNDWSKEKKAEARGTISNVVFKDIQVVDGLLPFSVFYGHDDVKCIDGVVIDNLTYMGRKITTEEEAKIRKTNTKNLIIK